MPISSRWTPEILPVSLPTWVLGHPTAPYAPSIANKPAFIDSDRPSTHVLTFTTLRLLTKRLALGLLSHPGLQPQILHTLQQQQQQQQQHGPRQREGGPRILVVAQNSIFYPAVLLGAVAAGCVFSGASPMFKTAELAHQITDSGASIVIASPDALETAVAAAAETGLGLENVYLLDESRMPGPSTASRDDGHFQNLQNHHHAIAHRRQLSGAASSSASDGDGIHVLATGTRIKHWTHLLADERLAEPWAWRDPPNPHDALCCLTYSSGTTGVPKGVEITHGAYVANGVGVVHVASLAPGFDVAVARRIGLCVLPLYHVFSQTAHVANATHMRVTTVVLGGGRFDLGRMLTAVERFRVTHLCLVPPILASMAQSPLARSHDLSSVEAIVCGAAPLPGDVALGAEAVVATHHRIRGKPSSPMGLLRQGWGMTEMTCTGLTWCFDSSPVDMNSVGELSPNCRAKIVSVADGVTEITAPRVPGELWITGPGLMRGYWGSEEATQNSIVVDDDTDPNMKSYDEMTGGSGGGVGTRWLRTGDVAFFDGPGGPNPGALFYLVDRVKELIKVKGRQVAPAELEAVLLSHERILDAAVVGVVVGGEEMPRAYVVVAQGEDMTERDAGAWVAARVAAYKKLVGGVVFVEEIPRNPSGKILRKVLRARAAKEVGDREPHESRLA